MSVVQEADEPVEGEAYVAGRAGTVDSDSAVPLDELGPPPWQLICTTCGVQFAPTTNPPEVCPVCADERQYVGWQGQRWTTLEALRRSGRVTAFVVEEPGLTSLETRPATAIGQRSMLVETPDGNILWDCNTHFDGDTVAGIRARGPIKAIAISHPHFYGTMSSWAAELDVPVYVHELDRQWVQDPGPWVSYWGGTQLELLPTVTIINCGGHFPGSAVLHWSGAADGKGVLLTGDTVKPVMDRRFVSFMYSIVNLIPMRPSEVRKIVERLESFNYDRIYSLWSGHVVPEKAKQSVVESARRYLHHILEEGEHADI